MLSIIWMGVFHEGETDTSFSLKQVVSTWSNITLKSRVCSEGFFHILNGNVKHVSAYSITYFEKYR